MANILPFDTTPYDKLPVSVMIYEPVSRNGGASRDFRIVYGNEIFARDWLATYHDSAFVGACLRERTLMDEHSISMLERFLTEPFRPFSTYIPMVSLYLHFVPITDLPAPNVHCRLHLRGSATSACKPRIIGQFRRKCRLLQHFRTAFTNHQSGRV